jgi:F0F1-type ATP synthase membrane subunit a
MVEINFNILIVQAVSFLIAVVPAILLPIIYLLGSLVVLIQAFVFTILSIFYIYGAVALHEENNHN